MVREVTSTNFSVIMKTSTSEKSIYKHEKPIDRYKSGEWIEFWERLDSVLRST